MYHLFYTLNQTPVFSLPNDIYQEFKESSSYFYMPSTCDACGKKTTNKCQSFYDVETVFTGVLPIPIPSDPGAPSRTRDVLVTFKLFCCHLRWFCSRSPKLSVLPIDSLLFCNASIKLSIGLYDQEGQLRGTAPFI